MQNVSIILFNWETLNQPGYKWKLIAPFYHIYNCSSFYHQFWKYICVTIVNLWFIKPEYVESVK